MMQIVRAWDRRSIACLSLIPYLLLCSVAAAELDDDGRSGSISSEHPSAAAEQTGSGPSALKITPVFRYAKHMADEPYAEYVGAPDGQLAEQFRRLPKAVGPMEVNCFSVSEIGIVIDPSDIGGWIYGAKTKYRFTWMHSSAPQDVVKRMQYRRNTPQGFLRSGIKLDDWLVDGTVYLTISVEGEIVFETQYILTNCGANPGASKTSSGQLHHIARSAGVSVMAIPFYPASNGLRIAPVARLVSTMDAEILIPEFREFVQNSGPGGVYRDPRFRGPGLGRDVTIVDCRTVQWIGIVFWVDYSKVPGGKDMDALRFSWTHPKLKLEGYKYDYYLGYLDYVKVGPNRVYSSRLRFEYERELLDGKYSVEVSHEGEVIYQDAFDLLGC